MHEKGFRQAWQTVRASDALLLWPSSSPGRSELGAVVRLACYLPGGPMTATALLSQKKTLYWFLGLLEGMTQTGQFKTAEIYSLKSLGDREYEIKVCAGLFHSGSLEKEIFQALLQLLAASGNACCPLVYKFVTPVSAPSPRDPLPWALSLYQGPALNLE